MEAASAVTSFTSAQRGHISPGFSSSPYPLLVSGIFPKSEHISTNPLIADGITLANRLHAASLNVPGRFVLHVWMYFGRCAPTGSRGHTDWSTSRPGREGRREGAQQLIYRSKLGMSSPRPTILCYFDSCHLKENKSAAVIRVRRALSSFLLNNSRVLADLLQPPMPASLMLLRSLPLLLPTGCGQIQLPALFPFQS